MSLPVVFAACGKTWRVHPACAAFPLLEGDELAAFVADVREHGLLEAVTVDGDELLDGRNRLLACDLAGVAPRFAPWRQNGASKTDWIVSLNLQRRHLSEGQRGVLAHDLHPIYEAEAKERQRLAAEETNRRKAEPQISLPARSRDAAERHKGESAAAAGAAVGVSGRTVQRVKEIAAKAPDLLDAVRSGAMTLPEAKGEIRQRAKAALAESIRQEPPPAAVGPFRVIVLDPPWCYDKRAEDVTHRARLSYPEMTNDAILALPVANLACDDAILWLWTTNAHLPLAFRCVERWGFTHKTVLTWVKRQMGAGDWLRGKTEHCIMAVRGHPIVTLTNQTTALEADRREHSRKPDEFFALVDALCPGSKLEMFAREQRPGWAAWGAETEKF